MKKILFLFFISVFNLSVFSMNPDYEFNLEQKINNTKKELTNLKNAPVSPQTLRKNIKLNNYLTKLKLQNLKQNAQ